MVFLRILNTYIQLTSSELKSRSKSQKRSKQPLSIIEVAEAALLGDLALGLQLIGWFISIGALIQWFSVVPFALITVRHRKRATYFATASTIGISVLIGGATLGLQVFLAGVLGVAVGEAFVKNRNFIYTAFITIVKGAIPAAVIGELLLIIFSKARTLTINQIKVVWDGIGNILKGMGKYLKSHPYVSKKSSPNAFDQLVHKMGSGLYRFSISFEHLIKWITSHWYLLFPLSIIISMLIVSVAMDIISRPLLKLILKNLRQPAVEFRADEEFDISFENSLSQERNGISEFTDESIARRTNDEQVVAPLPVKLENVSFSYKNSARPTIDQINIDISKEEVVGVVGQNGSGKSTIGKVLIGMKPDSGTVQRNGKVGLGQIAGTSVIFQRPESQVLGSMVEDDVVWGLSEKTATEVDVDKILAEVGLEGFGKD